MTPQDFFKYYAPYAESTQVKYGVPASITLAQAALESSWGTSGLTTSANNFFGIKADKSWKGQSTAMPTQEFVNGAYVTVNAGFRKYNSAQDSFNDHAKFLIDNGRYKKLFSLQVTDYIGWAQGLKSAGYATDPTYDSKLINLVTKYNLTQYDKAAVVKKKIRMVAFILIGAVAIGAIGLFFFKGK